MGCAFPPTATFILLGGGVFTPEWTLWSLSGIVFLGVGDSCAAIMGKWYGKTKWRQLSKKTQEGSTYCIIGTGVIYYALCEIVDPKSKYLFLCFIFAAIPTAVIEGNTFQYDNLVCSVFFFAMVIFFNTIFQ